MHMHAHAACNLSSLCTFFRFKGIRRPPRHFLLYGPPGTGKVCVCGGGKWVTGRLTLPYPETTLHAAAPPLITRRCWWRSWLQRRASPSWRWAPQASCPSGACWFLFPHRPACACTA